MSGRAKGKPVFYWDSCVFLAWINGERTWSDEVISGLQYLAAQVSSGSVVLVTSAITRTEIYTSNMTPEQKKLYNDVLLRKNFVEYDVNPKIADRASSIREYYHARSIDMDLPDAIHGATAPAAEAEVMWTLDGEGRRKRPSKLLSMNGNLAGSPLAIYSPAAAKKPQPPRDLFAQQPDADDE